MSLDPVTIGRYRILGTLGEGGMGTVYLAEDPLLNRPLAIKVVRSGIERADVLARFRREAEISARLNHPNLVTVFDVGDEPGVGPFLAMEYVEGQSLAELLRAGRPERVRALGLLLQAAAALEAVHRAGVIHRDIKPENFLVAAGDQLKLMDFGLSRGEGQMVSTTTSTFLGTPGYAAPELLTGGTPCEASDRWALALLAAEMLLGRSPFAGDSIGTTLYRIVHTPPDLPADLDPDLRAVLEKALAKDPVQRHPSLRAFLDELLQALHLEEAERRALHQQQEGPVSPTTAPVPQFQRRRTLWIGVLGLAGAGATAALWVAFRPARQVVEVLSDPPGATILLDQRQVGMTPLAALDITGSAGELTAELPGYRTFHYRLLPGEKAVRFHLVPAPWSLAVNTDPPGAAASLDGTFVGSTPIPRLQVPGEGRHTLRLTRPGYLPWTAILERGHPLPDPIPLQKASRPPARPAEAPAEESRVRTFFRKLFKNRERAPS